MIRSRRTVARRTVARRTVARRATGILCLALLAASCGSAPVQDEDASEAAALAAAEAAEPQQPAWEAKPWTKRFQEPAAIVAEEIHISGPKGLLDHVVTADSPDTTYIVKTTKDGLLQERTAREGHEFVKILTQVDQWRIVGTQKVVILERPGRVPVVVEARGNAFYNDEDLSLPEQGESLRFVGEIEG